MKTAITSPRKTDLCTVTIQTKFGDQYTFPAMDKNALGKVIPKGSSSVPPGTPTLTMVNASYSVLSVPFLIVAAVRVNGEPWWACLA
jgi:hypothetical protein